MDIEVTKKTNEPLMKRIYFEAKIIFQGKTPSRIDIKKELCKKLDSKDNLTIIRKIKTDYGSERAIIYGFIYESEEIIKKIENKHVLLRHLTKEEQTAEKEKMKLAKQAAAPTAKKKKK
ncbi:MAG: 30S ribosomal protein S24e [Candidatus Woesearchaeota archaeon]|nr:MAG: 30S ribosomal protein S24e [Candidatus Woesearchaeota archaeon]